MTTETQAEWTQSIEGRASGAVNLMAHYLIENKLGYSPEFDDADKRPSEATIALAATTDGGLQTMLSMARYLIWPSQGNYRTEPTIDLAAAVISRAVEVADCR